MTSSSERIWKRVESVFEAALPLREAEREHMLDGLSATEPEVAAEVRSLLSSESDSGTFLERPILEWLGHGQAPEVGQQVGPYKLLRMIGRGGMGTVYEAEVEPLRRRAALKVLNNARFATPEHIARFEREAESLARLEHPHIARLYEAGRSEEGTPYIAMELVEGETLDEYVRQELPTRADRLRLFTQICDAVQDAHENGVIHRDLKPGNVIVQGTGASAFVKVLDFGLARIVARGGPADGRTLTASGSVVGTLAYSSPEQAGGRTHEVGLGTDVYSLGVMLYELLTDTLPYDVNQGSLLEGIRVVCERRPVKLSSIDRSLRGDLETIVLKALEKEPARRYATVVALGQDVRLFLEGEPILARPPSPVQQLRRFVSRHKLASSFAATTFVLITSAAVAMGILWFRAEEARQAKSGEEARTRDVNRFLRETFARNNPEIAGATVVDVRTLLDQTAGRIEAELKDNTRVASELRMTMGEVYAGLGDYPIAEIHLSRALTIRRTARPVDESELAQSLVGLADVWIKLGREPKARALLEEAVEIQRRRGPAFSFARSLVLQARAVRADVSDTARLAVAEALYLEALEVLDMREGGRTGSVPEDHQVLPSTPQGTLLPESLNGLADVIAEQGREAEAEPLYDQAWAAYEELPVDQNGSDVARALCLAELSVSAGRRGRGESAATSLAEALVVLESHLGVEHPYTLRVLAQHGHQVAINARAAPGGSRRP